MNVTGKSVNEPPGALIFVVEDEETQRELTCLVLSKAGYDTHACADGATALRDFEEMRPDLFLVDVLMPEMDGIELCREIRARPAGKDVPIVVVTSLEYADWIEHAYDSGATDFVTKPVNWAILSHRIRHILKSADAEAQVVATHTRLIDAIESFPADFRFFDAEDRLLLTNARAVENAPLIAEHLQRGNRFEDILRASVAKGTFKNAIGREETWIQERLAARALPSATHILEHMDGRWIQVIERATADGGRVAIGVDITELKQREISLEKARAKAEAADQAKSAFLANMSHELRTPLNAIIGFGQFLHSEALGPLGVKAYKEYAKDIVESGDHLLALINDILDMSRIEAGRMELQEAEVHLSSTVQACLRLVEDRAAQAGVILENGIGESSLVLYADARIFKQMLLNVLSNAVKFTDKDGIVRLSADCRADGSLAISLSDTGIGVAPEEIDKILTSFGQADGSRARQYEGTGLGLPLTKAMIELHGGTLEFDSVLGQGSVVTLVIPVERLMAQSGSDQQNADVA